MGLGWACFGFRVGLLWVWVSDLFSCVVKFRVGNDLYGAPGGTSKSETAVIPPVYCGIDVGRTPHAVIVTIRDNRD